jgi:ribonuclease VapC
MFIDTSAIVAILSRESDAPELSLAIEAADTPVTSGLVLLEAAMRLSTKLDIHPSAVGEALAGFLAQARIEIMPIGKSEAFLAIDAFGAYGKGRGHPAQLNLADCLSYACAKSRGVPLLYKGRDFGRTDLA